MRLKTLRFFGEKHRNWLEIHELFDLEIAESDDAEKLIWTIFAGEAGENDGAGEEADEESDGVAGGVD